MGRVLDAMTVAACGAAMDAAGTTKHMASAAKADFETCT